MSVSPVWHQKDTEGITGLVCLVLRQFHLCLVCLALCQFHLCLVCLALCRFHLCDTKRILKGLQVWSVWLYVSFTCVAPKGYWRDYRSGLSGFTSVSPVWHQKDTEGITGLVSWHPCLCTCSVFWPYIGSTHVVLTESRRDCMSLLWSSYGAKLQLASWPLRSWGMHLLSRLYCPLFSWTGQLGLDQIFNICARVWRCDVHGQQFGKVKPTGKICPWYEITKYSKELHTF